MNNLKFRRQFLLSPKPTEVLSNWQVRNCGESYLYVHPDLELNYLQKENKTFILLGYWLNPHCGDKTNEELLEEIANRNANEEDFFEYLNKLVGRFVLITKTNETYKVFHDACGLRTVYYSRNEDGMHLASQPELFKLIFDLVESPERVEYVQSQYVKNTKEHWLPCGITLLQNVCQLLPNFYFDTALNKEIRYWPNAKHKIVTRTREEGVTALANLLSKTMKVANNRFELAAAMTAGLDSRLLLSATKNIAKDVFFYTLKYRNLNSDSADISIPRKVLENQGYTHNVIDCTEKADESFLKLYKENTSNSHLDDWGTIAWGISKSFPAKRIAVRGNCVEIGRSAYFIKCKLNGVITAEQIKNIVPGWRDLSFVEQELSNWIKSVPNVEKLGYDIRDLFYMEHRVGSWQAQSQLEWDIAQEIFIPFNNREIIDIMLSVDSQFRNNQNDSFFTETVKLLWPEVLSAPINPISKKEKIKGYIKSTLISFGLFERIKKF